MAEFTNKEVAARYRIVNDDHADVKKVTPKGTRALKDITPAMAAFMAKVEDADIALIEDAPAASTKTKTVRQAASENNS